MASYLKKCATSLVLAKNYVAQWSADHLYSNEALIVPFPTIALFDPDRKIWSINVKAWVYLPFEGKKIKSYCSSLPNVVMRKIASTRSGEMTDKPNEEVQALETFPELNRNRNANNQEAVNDEDLDDQSYQISLERDFGTPNENPGRLSLFFVGRSVKVVTKSIFNDIEHFLQPSDESGFIEEKIELTDDEVESLSKPIRPEVNDRTFDYEIQINEAKNDTKTDDFKSFKCTIYVLGVYGISVISDIDDTIKITRVLSKRALLKHTFYDEFIPVNGMSELYQNWSEQKCQFHYVSSSPWQLYPALRSFLEKYNYPMGTMNLRKFEWSLKFLKPRETYKIETITELINAYPLRRYICIGDSGESDPEIYAKLFNTFPVNIAHIFIRDVCFTPECLPTCQERYKKAFEGVPKTRWTIFKDPTEIDRDIEKIITD